MGVDPAQAESGVRNIRHSKANRRCRGTVISFSISLRLRAMLLPTTLSRQLPGTTTHLVDPLATGVIPGRGDFGK